MSTRTLFLPVAPIPAYLVVRDRSIATEADSADVVLLARRGACPGGTAVGISVAEQHVRDLDGRGRYLVDRRVAEQGITRAYQPWHADVETDEVARWRGYLDDTYGLTLRNLLDAQTPGTLRTAEDNRVEARLIELALRPVEQTFDLAHLREIHRRLFQDVYPWAGETRTVNMKRPGSPSFGRWDEVESRWDGLADHIERQNGLRGMSRDDFVPAVASVYNEVNTVHAFREGNGRTQRVFMDDLARGAGWQLKWTRVSGPINDMACEAARAGNDRQLRDMLDQIAHPAAAAAVWTVEQRAALELTSVQSCARGASSSTPEAGSTYRSSTPATEPGVRYRPGSR